jgi:glycine betaine catabolism B
MCNTKHIQLSEMRAVEDDSENVYVTNIEGKYYAIGNVCTRLAGPLAEGKLEGYEIQCPWRGSKFNVRTGKQTRPPVMRPEAPYESKSRRILAY